jgi:hypothetical protein
MNNKANSQIDVDNFSTGVENLVDTSNLDMMTMIGGDLGSPGVTLRNRMTLLKTMVEKINNPVVEGLASDMLSVLKNWLDDPQVLCCLIQGIWAAYLANNKEGTQKLLRNSTGNFSLAESDFGKFLDVLISLIDFIIIFIAEDIKRFVFLVPDFIKEIMNGVMGAILLVIQEVAFALRDSIISSIFGWMDSWDTNQTWSKCLPLKQMINILKKYIQDYGLLAGLLEKIKGFTCGTVFEFKKSVEVLPKAKDIEFLYWLRDLLVKLKRSVLNFDFCVEYDYNPGSNILDTLNSEQNTSSATIDKLSDPTKEASANLKDYQGYTVASNGTILIDKDKITNDNSIWLPRVSNSFIRDFVHDQYDIPYEVIDNTINRGTSADNIQGSNINSTDQSLFDRCPGTPASKEILSWIMNIKTI